MSAIASSSRSLYRLQPIKQQIRTVIHHARPPRQPILHSPHEPKPISPTPGTSTPQASSSSSSTLEPSSSSSSAFNSSIELEGTNLTLHHSRPSSAPSYTTGSVPDFLKWAIYGKPVHLSGDEGAPPRKQPQPRRGVGNMEKWDGGVKMQIIDMRSRGMSRSQIAKTLNIPIQSKQNIARLAPLSKEQQDKKDRELENVKSKWGARKRLDRAKREKRREFW